MAQKFIENGYDVVETEEMADVYIINTCTVTNMADRKSRQMLRRVKQINPNSIVVATGCYAQVAKDELQKIENIDLVLGINEKNDIVDYVNKFLSNKTKEMEISDVLHQVEFLDFGTVTHTEKTRMVIKIQDGCDRFCSYCIIPYARGRVRSRMPENIIEEISHVAKEGIKEVVITGIHIASYGKDFKNNYKLIDLLEEVNKIDGIKRIRLGSLEPRIITEEFLERLTKVDAFCPHFHLSLQSGCDETLKRMNRRYTSEEYLEGCKLIRKYYPKAAITTDVIVGFPGETEEEFNKCKNFLEKVNFAQMHIFKYSRREGTKAAIMPEQIEDEVKALRSDALIELNERLHKDYLNSFIGDTKEVLFEEKVKIYDKEYFIGHTMEYVKVAIDTDENLENRIVAVKLKELLNNEIVLAMF